MAIPLTERLEAFRPSLEGVAKKLADDLWGGHGPAWGTTLSELEDLALAARTIVAEKLLELGLERQANPTNLRPADLSVCPDCQRPCGTDREPVPRTLQTRAGEVYWHEPHLYCSRCRRAFFPQSKSLGLDRGHFSPALQAKITFAGSNETSYAQAEQALRVLAELDVSDKQTRRVCQSVGRQRVAERDAAVADYQAKPLAERKAAPPGVPVPAVVGVDGGRLQILERTAQGQAVVPVVVEDIQDDVVIPDTPPPTKKTLHWREDKIALLLTVSSQVQPTDPCPQIPASFVNPHWIAQLAKELKGRAPPGTAEVPGPAPPDPTAADADVTWKPPEVDDKQLVATRRPWESFGPWWPNAPGRWVTTRRSGGRLWGMVPRRTGRCGGSTFPRWCPSWTLSMR